MLRKLLTKPLWWWERKRPYPIRSRFHLLPPLGVVGGRARFVVLTTPQGLNDALWTAWSWYRYLRPHGFELQLAVDGEFPAGEEQAVQRLFPGISVYDVWSVLSKLCDEQPALGIFLRGHPLGRKLGLMLALSNQGAVLYSDGDVLAFNPPADLLTCVNKSVPCYFMEDIDGTRDPQIVEKSKALGLEYIPRFNSGCLFIPKGALSIDLAAQLLAEWRPPADSWFTEQTVMSILMRKANAQALPDDRYVISARRQFYSETDVEYRDIVARHFTGTVRHLMYGYGMPAILEQSQQALAEKEQGVG
jgi:hypothetical protein